MNPRRYSSRPLPARRYLPGHGEHPSRREDPRGDEVEPGDTLGPDRWWTCHAFLHGVDLWNAGFFWEAHELFEALWRDDDARPDVRAALQGLIQLAAAILQHRLGRSRGAHRLLERARPKLSPVDSDLLGFEGGTLCRQTEAFLQGRLEAPPHLLLDEAQFPASG